MLSYDKSVPLNGQAPSLPSNVAATTNGAPAMAAPQTAYPVDGAITASQPRNGDGASDHQIWLVTGPAGSGKSTVAKHLASSLNYSYIEGDEFHPPANIEKMSAGIPLTDADRWDWLTALREESIRQIAEGTSGVVLTCSALKRKYRDVIRVAPYFNSGVRLHFIYLSATEDMLLQRVAARENHYMGANMVQSQFAALEPPMPDETDIISVDVSRSMDEVKGDALAKALQIMAANKQGK